MEERWAPPRTSRPADLPEVVPKPAGTAVHLARPQVESVQTQAHLEEADGDGNRWRTGGQRILIVERVATRYHG